MKKLTKHHLIVGSRNFAIGRLRGIQVGLSNVLKALQQDLTQAEVDALTQAKHTIDEITTNLESRYFKRGK